MALREGLSRSWRQARPGLSEYSLAVKDPRILVRVVLGLLLLANLVAALFAFRPWGGSAEDLARQVLALRTQLDQQRARLSETGALVAKVEKARTEGDRFLTRATMDRRTTFSTIVDELDRAATQAGIKPKERAIVLEPIEGSDTLSMMSITAGYEGSYVNLTRFVNLLDKSPRFLIIESMSATPQQSGAVLNVSIKMDTFVREDPGRTL